MQKTGFFRQVFLVAVGFVIALVVFAGWRGKRRVPIPASAPASTESQAAAAFGTDAESDPRSDSATRPTQRPRGARHAPLPVQPFHGQYCASLGPPGWVVLDENPQRAGFGADLASEDRMVYAGYSIFPSGAMAGAGFETPGQAVEATLTSFGTVQVRFGRTQQVGPNVYLVEYLSATNHGVAFYQVIPAGADGAMIVMRTAGTSASPGYFEKRGAEAMAVARSLHCQVPMVPPSPDPPGLNAKAESPRNDSDESDTLYNTWLEREYYHNSQTGENFWVSPSEDYWNTGPEGAGYYATYGNSLIKLTPGYAQP